MKKRFLYVLAVMATVLVFNACGSDDPDGNTCACDEYDSETHQYIGSSGKNIDPASYNLSSCSALASHLNQFTSDTYITCH